MKKLSLILLALTMCVSLCACSSDRASEETIIIPDKMYFDDFEGAFYYLSGYYGDAKEVIVPNKYRNEDVKYIDDYAFKFCDELEQVVVSDGIEWIGSYAFEECRNLKTVKIGKGLEWIEMYAFFACSNLETIELPKTLERIGYKAFMGCKNLKSITIPVACYEIEEDAFAGCENLQIQVDPKNERFYVKDGKLIEKRGSEDVIIWNGN